MMDIQQIDINNIFSTFKKNKKFNYDLLGTFFILFFLFYVLFRSWHFILAPSTFISDYINVSQLDIFSLTGREYDTFILWIRLIQSFVIFLLILVIFLSFYLRYFLQDRYKSLLSLDKYERLLAANKFWKYIQKFTAENLFLDISIISKSLNFLDTFTSLFNKYEDIGLLSTKFFIMNISLPNVIGDLPLPNKFPLVICHPGGIDDCNHFSDILSMSCESTAIAVFWILGDKLLFNWEEFSFQLKRAYAIETIFIAQPELEQIVVRSDNFDKALRSEILKQINITLVSPFISTGPARDKMFFGRESEMREITQGIKNSNYIIIGGRRIGKTSILGILHQHRFPAAKIKSIYHVNIPKLVPSGSGKIRHDLVRTDRAISPVKPCAV